MKHRINWKHSSNSNPNQFNFKWKYSTKKMGYQLLTYDINLRKDKIKIVNLFEGHEKLTNKMCMFINFMRYCNVKSFIILENKY
jgi:hypothetical protein